MTPHQKIKSFEDRKKTLKKKASELATLCGVPVCLVCVNPDGTTETWPEEKERVVKVLMDYKGNQITVKDESKVGEKGKEKVADKAPRVFETWDSRFEYLPEEALMDVLEILDRQLKVVDEVVGKGQTRKKRKVMQDKVKSIIVHGADGDGSREVGLVTRNLLGLVSLNQTNSSNSDVEIPDLELRL
ncbi:unnamed protein product [Dovyalis caffra]|uniref:MADS-box domain-containing protein n=1 Tax=Dovyalis caffra TaxID=77055 RepID=A0AAV1QTX3_9ROSI|nr:unnamed protein product [Dovyalis caffra]